MSALKFVLLTVLIAVPLVGVTPLRTHAATVSSPILERNDWWKYDVQINAAPLVLTGTLLVVNLGIETITVGGVSFATYKLGQSASGIASGNSITGTWTKNGVINVRTTDFAEIRSSITTTITAGSTVTRTDNSTTTSAIPAFSFPLIIGSTWGWLSSTITNSVETNSTNPTPRYRSITTGQTHYYTVLSSQLFTTAAGTFDAYTIRWTSLNTTDSAYTMYSPEVNNIVTESLYAGPGVSISSRVLLDFRSWAYNTGSQFHLYADGKLYNAQLRSDITPVGGVSFNSSSITFTLSGLDGVTGMVNMTFPRQFNSTIIKVYADTNRVPVTIASNSTYYFIAFSLTLSTHAISILYALQAAPSGTLQGPLTIVAIVASAAMVAIITLWLVGRRRSKLGKLPTERFKPESKVSGGVGKYLGPSSHV